MSTAQQDYQVFARTAPGGKVALYLGTTEALRDGQWYSPAITNAPGLVDALSGDVFRAASITLDLAMALDDPDRATLLAMDEGTQWLVTCEATRTGADGAPATVSHSKWMSLRGVRIHGARISLTLYDLDEGALDALWPPHTWRAEDWPQLTSDDAGRPIPDPVGTALKLPCPLLDADTDHQEWLYGVCGGEAMSLPVNFAISNIFRVAGDHTALVQAGGTIYMVSPIHPGAGRYEVTAVALVGSTTWIYTAHPIPSGDLTGATLRIMPQVLTVYRNGRIVPPGEYEVINIHAPHEVINGDFSDGLTGWTVGSIGAGSVSVVDGACQITSTDNANYREISQGFDVDQGLPWAVRVHALAGYTDAQLRNPSQDWRRIKAGTRRTVVISRPDSRAGTVTLGVWGYAGTARVDDISILPYNLVLIRFRREQRDFSGSLYRIEADVRGPASRNAVREIQRLITAAGLTVDTGEFDAAAAYADTHRMLVDCDHGRTDRRRIRAILEDLAYIARATVRRLADGSYGIAQDRATAITDVLDSRVDALAVDDIDWTPSRPKSVAIAYRPSSAEPDRMQHEPRRPVAGGTRGDAPPRTLRYLRDHEAADRLLCYLALRAQYARRLQVRLYGARHALAAPGTGLAVAAPEMPAALDVTVWSAEQIVAGARCELAEYDPAIHVYTPGDTLPDAGPAYEPDYSHTPPAAPTALTLTALASSTATNGQTTARATARVTAPAVNWGEIWIVAIHNITGEIVPMRAAPISPGSDVHEAVISPLRPGEVYQLHGYAISPFGLRGPAVTVFNAFPVGGGAADTVFTAPGAAALPPNVVGITAQQGTGRLIEVRWAAVAAADLAEYVVERRLGGGAWSEYWRGLATNMVDRNVNYGPSYQYRVRARNTWGQYSATWAQSGGVSISGNVYGGSGGDIPATTVASVNRTNTSTVATVAFGELSNWRVVSVTHGLGRIPIAVPSAGGPYLAGLIGLDANNAQIGLMGLWQPHAAADGTVGMHTHEITIVALDASVRIDFW